MVTVLRIAAEHKCERELGQTLLLQAQAGTLPSLKASTYVDYSKTIRNMLIPEFGDILVVELNRQHVIDWAKTLDCSNKRIGNLLSPLRAAITDAVNNGVIDIAVYPLKDWTYKKQEGPRTVHVDPFTFDEQQQTLETLDDQM
jgi:integrase